MTAAVKLSCQENLPEGKTFADRCRILADLGFQAVEIWGWDLLGKPDVEKEMAATLERCGLRVSVIVVGYRGGLLEPDPGLRANAFGDICSLLAIAGRLRAVGLIMVPIFGPPKVPDLSPLTSAVELEDRLIVEYLKRLGPVAQGAGTTLILEPLNRGETHYLRTLDHAARLIDAAGVPGLALMGDLYHMNIEETNTPEALRRNAKKLAHVHLADNTRLEPGTGMTNFAAAFAALKDAGFGNYVSLECGFSTPDRNAALRKTAEFLNALI